MVISALLWLASGLYSLAGLSVSREVKPPTPTRVLITVACVFGQAVCSMFGLYSLLTSIEMPSGYKLFSKLYWALYPLVCTVTTISMAFRYQYFSTTSVRAVFVQDWMRAKGIARGPPRAWQLMAVCWAAIALLSVILGSIAIFEEFINVHDHFMTNDSFMKEIMEIVQFILSFPSHILFYAILYHSSLLYLIEFWIVGVIHRELTVGGRVNESVKEAKDGRDTGVSVIGSVSSMGVGRSIGTITNTKRGNEPLIEVEDLEVEHGREPNIQGDSRGGLNAGCRREQNLTTSLDMKLSHDNAKKIKLKVNGGFERESVLEDAVKAVSDKNNEKEKGKSIGENYGKALSERGGRGKKRDNGDEDKIKLDGMGEESRRSEETEADARNERGNDVDDGIIDSIFPQNLTRQRCKELLELLSQSKKLRLETQTWLHVPLCFMMFSASWYFPILLRNYAHPDVEYSNRLAIAMYLILGTITKLAPAFSNQLAKYRKNSLLDQVSLRVMNTDDPELRKALLKLHASISDQYPDSPNVLLDFDLSLIDILVNMAVLSATTFF